MAYFAAEISVRLVARGREEEEEEEVVVDDDDDDDDDKSRRAQLAPSEKDTPAGVVLGDGAG